jgi:hypothetical protein
VIGYWRLGARWAAAGAVAAAILAALVLGGWRAGWWFSNRNASLGYQQVQLGASNQDTLRTQITAKLAEVETITVQIAADPPLNSPLKAQRAAVAGIVCSDAAGISGVALPAQQAAWIARNCTAGILSSSSPLYVNGAP